MINTRNNYDDEWDEITFTCEVCGCILDGRDGSIYTCDDIRCIRTWDDRVEEAEERCRQQIIREQEF